MAGRPRRSTRPPHVDPRAGARSPPLDRRPDAGAGPGAGFDRHSGGPSASRVRLGAPGRRLRSVRSSWRNHRSRGPGPDRASRGAAIDHRVTRRFPAAHVRDDDRGQRRPERGARSGPRARRRSGPRARRDPERAAAGSGARRDPDRGRGTHHRRSPGPSRRPGGSARRPPGIPGPAARGTARRRDAALARHSRQVPRPPDRRASAARPLPRRVRLHAARAGGSGTGGGADRRHGGELSGPMPRPG